MQAIHTKYIPATNTSSAKIKAYNEAFPRGVKVSIDYSLDAVERHAVAVRAFLDKYLTEAPKVSSMSYGGSADGKGYCFCFVQSTVEV